MTFPMPEGVLTDFLFDPERHDFLFDGTQLKTGMRVLIEDRMFWDRVLFSEREVQRVLENQRWCTVGRVESNTYPEYDEEGYQVVGQNTIVSFEAIYDDGHVCKRRYNASFAWYVEKPIGEYAQIVRTGLRRAFPDLVLA